MGKLQFLESERKGFAISYVPGPAKYDDNNDELERFDVEIDTEDAFRNCDECL